MREVNIEKRLVEAVKKIGGRAYKFESPGNNGVPDRLILLPKGRVVFVECKAPKNGKISRLQRLQKKRLESLGQQVLFLKTKDEVDNFIKELENDT